MQIAHNTRENVKIDEVGLYKESHVGKIPE